MPAISATPSVLSPGVAVRSLSLCTPSAASIPSLSTFNSFVSSVPEPMRAPKVVIEPCRGVKATGTVIYLHGGTGSAEASSAIAFKMQPDLPHLRFVFPNATLKAIPALDNTELAAWYSVKRKMPDEFDLAWFQVSQEKESESFYDLKHNTETIKQLIDDEIAKGIRPDRIVLAGFSQGAAQALVSACMLPFRLAGVSSLVGFLPLEQHFYESIASNFAELSIHFRLAEKDEMLHESWPNHTEQTLARAGALINYQKMPGKTHFCEMDPDILQGTCSWLKTILPN